jgi:trehalose-phosphatase
MIERPVAAVGAVAAVESVEAVPAPATATTRTLIPLTALVSRPGRLLVVSDFDGTLAEGSRDPAATRIVPLARVALRRLAGLAAGQPERLAVAVLTGRTVADAAARVRVGGIHYLGDHGLQTGSFPRRGRPERPTVAIQPGHEAAVEPAERLATRVPELLGRPSWLFVERKGPSVAFHVRQAEDRAAARAAVEAAIATVDRELPEHDLAHYRGRLVVDLRPRAAGGKRETMERLLAELEPSTVICFGDDSSDADAFRVLRAAREAGRIDGLAIGVVGPHGMPDDVRAAADLVLETPFLAARMLASIARLVERERAASGLERTTRGGERAPGP